LKIAYCRGLAWFFWFFLSWRIVKSYFSALKAKLTRGEGVFFSLSFRGVIYGINKNPKSALLLSLLDFSLVSFKQ
jgi:hypothetical protein